MPMTKIEGVPDNAEAKPGMAFFAGTGPFAAKCGECVHRGYRRRSANGHYDPNTGETHHRIYHVGGCAMFHKLSGHHGPPIEKDWEACKYFERKPK